MPGQFAERTKVAANQTRAEIEKVLHRYKATGFMYGWQGSAALIAFEMNNRRIRFMVPLPVQKSFSSEAKYEQAVRQRWRAALLTIKAKLESVASGIVSFESEWLAHFIMPNGATIGETLIPQIEAVYESGNVPPLLPAPKDK